MRILLTGASGFVGGYLGRALVTAGHEVFGLVRDLTSYRPSDGVTPVQGDLYRPLAASLPRVDAIAHFAQGNVPFPDEATALYAVNTGATQQLLDHARRLGTERFLYASSASVYGFGGHPFRESDPVMPHDFYAVTKINSEQLVSAYDDFFHTAVLRLVAPYGPGQTGRMIPGVIGRVRDGRPVTLNDFGRPRMNPIYVSDAVRAVVMALELEGNHVVNVAGDDVVGIRELALLAGEALGREPVFEEGAVGAAGDVVADTRLLHELFDLRPLIAIEDGIRETVAAADVVEARG